jgi:hypothetical protein
MQLTGSIYVDPTNNNFIDRSALITTQRDITNPTGVVPSFWTSTIGNGDNTTFRGVSGGYFKASDRTGLAAGSRGVLYGLQLSVEPTAAHRNNYPYDDAVGLVVNNEGTKRGTEGIYIGNGGSVATDANNTFGQNWDAGLGIDCPATVGIYYTKTYNHGIDTTWGGTGGSGATFNNAFLKVKAGTTIIESKNNAGSAVVPVLGFTTGDRIQIGNSTSAVVDPTNNRIGVGTSTPSYTLHAVQAGATAHVESSSGQPILRVASYQAGFAPGSMTFQRRGAGNTATPDSVAVGEFRFDGLNTSAGYCRFAGIGVDIGTNSANGALAIMTFSVSNGAASPAANDAFEVFRLSPSLAAVTRDGVVLGYGTGSGGAATQGSGSGKATGITLNKTNGVITMDAAALAAGASVTFTLTNSQIAVTDTVIVNTADTLGDDYTAVVHHIAAGSCKVRVTNVSGGSLSEAVKLNFAVIKAVAS